MFQKIFFRIVGKRIISIVFVASAFQLAQAQEEFSYNFSNAPTGSGYTGIQAALNVALLLPLDYSFKQYYSSGIGSNIQLKYMIDSKFAIGGYFGYNLVAARTPVAGQISTMMQYGATAEYYLFQGSSPYFGLDIGNYTFNTVISGSSVGQTQNYKSSQSNIGIGPNFGYAVQLSPNMIFNANLKYNHVFNTIVYNYQIPTQFLQLNVGLIFNLSYRPAKSDE